MSLMRARAADAALVTITRAIACSHAGCAGVR
jgi:hypothetical protein